MSAIDATPAQRLTADQLAAPRQWSVVFAAGAAVLPTHRLVVSGTDARAGAWTRTVQVESLSAPASASSVEISRTALCTDLGANS